MTQQSTKPTNNHHKPLIYFGIFFIISFASYGTGATLIDNITSGQNILSVVAADNFTVVLAAMLMGVVHTFTNIALPVILLPILKPFNLRFTYAYFAACITATIVLIFGVFSYLLLVPLADTFVNQGAVTTPYFEAITAILVKSGLYGYHLGMALWAIGGLFLCFILYQSQLISRFMSVWGIVGYSFLLFGSISEIFAHNSTIEMLSVIPGGLFEVVFSIWLIVKGMRVDKWHNQNQAA